MPVFLAAKLHNVNAERHTVKHGLCRFLRPPRRSIRAKIIRLVQEVHATPLRNYENGGFLRHSPPSLFDSCPDELFKRRRKRRMSNENRTINPVVLCAR